MAPHWRSVKSFFTCLYKIPQSFAKVTLQFIATRATELLQLDSVRNYFKKPFVLFCVTMQHFEQQINFAWTFWSGFHLSVEMNSRLLGFALLSLLIGLHVKQEILSQSRVNPNIAVIRSCMFSCASYWLHVFPSFFNWFTACDWSVSLLLLQHSIKNHCNTR